MLSTWIPAAQRRQRLCENCQALRSRHLTHLAGIIHERFCRNRGFAARTSLVYLVGLVQPNNRDRPNRRDRPNEQDSLADFFSILLEAGAVGRRELCCLNRAATYGRLETVCETRDAAGPLSLEALLALRMVGPRSLSEDCHSTANNLRRSRSEKSSAYSYPSEYASGFFEPAASHLPATPLPRNEGLPGQTPSPIPLRR